MTDSRKMILSQRMAMTQMKLTFFLIFCIKIYSQTVASPITLDQAGLGFVVPEAKHLIYDRVPTKWIVEARKFGKIARNNYSLEFGSKLSAEEKLKLYKEQFNKCSNIDQKFVELQFHETELSSKDQLAEKFATSIGIDSMTANLFALPKKERQEVIGSTCARNELRFQCVLGFFNSREDKFNEHMEDVKKLDGVFKVMMDWECPLAALEQKENVIEMMMLKIDPNDKTELNSIFQCVHKNAIKISEKCSDELNEYTTTRQKVNDQVVALFDAAIANVDRKLANALASEKEENALQFEKEVQKSQSLIRRTLLQLVHLEGPKCEKFKKMENCLSEDIDDYCGKKPASELAIMLKTGYMQRERGEFLNQLYYAMEIAANGECLTI